MNNLYNPINFIDTTFFLLNAEKCNLTIIFGYNVPITFNIVFV